MNAPPPGFNPRTANVRYDDSASSSSLTSSAAAPSLSMFSNANNTVISNSSFSLSTNTNSTYNFLSAPSPLDPLYRSVAPNAILNSGGRADEVRCYPGTREEVIGLVEKSITQEYSGPRMLWLSGPAGAGKSAIMQTVAERCEVRGVPHANFFFFRADYSRANATAFVATLVHQIIQCYPFVAPSVAAALTSDPLLLQMGLQKQFDVLLHQTLPPLNDSSPIIRPIALLIDGLDECDSENKIAQRQILLALDHLLAQKGAHFRVVVASRVEPQITMAFKQLHSQVDSIFLDEQYSPGKDIRTFVTAEFENIKSTHYLADTLRPDWPSDAEIDAIVSKSSGQFIFAATVMRFITQSSASPVLSLKKVQGIVPPAKNTPFAYLDAIYSYILGQVDDLDAAKTILAMRLMGRNIVFTLKCELEAYNSTFSEEVVDSCMSELCSLVNGRGYLLEFFHASFPDFLKDKTRAGHYHIDLEAFCTAAIPIWWASNHKPSDTTNKINIDALYICRAALACVHQPTPTMTSTLMKPHADLLDMDQNSILSSLQGYPDDLDELVNELYRIYTPHDPQSFTKIMQTWGHHNQFFNRYLTPQFLESGELEDDPRNPKRTVLERLPKVNAETDSSR